MKKRVLITGGSGFVGSHLIDLLHNDQTLELHITTFGAGQENYVAQNYPTVRQHSLDLTDTTTTQSLLQQLKPDQIYHLASFAHAGSSFDLAKQVLSNNIQLQVTLLEAVRDQAPEARLVAVTTADFYQPSSQPIDESAPIRPNNPYSVSKISQDMLLDVYARAYALDIIRVRPFNHIGPRQALGFVVSDFASKIVAIERGEQTELTVGNLQAVRDFTSVQDMVRAYRILMEKGKPGEVYNIGSGTGISIQEMLDTLVSLAKAPISVQVDPKKIRPSDVPYLVANAQKIRALGWQPEKNLTQTLAEILDYWRQIAQIQGK